MICTPFEKDGVRGFLCTSGRRPRCGCGRPGTQLCDWKVERRGKKATCDAAICDICTLKPAEGKDLCPTHGAEWKARAR